VNGAKFRVLLLAISCNVVTWLTLAAANAFAQSGTASAERGAKLYLEKMCYTCHGYAGQGGERGSGPTLTPGLWPYPAFAQQVRHPRQDMPRYGSRFVSEDELADIYAYLASISSLCTTKAAPQRTRREGNARILSARLAHDIDERRCAAFDNGKRSPQSSA